ncbi:hypothetical protein, variant 1 [Aphanomyces invadans]|uniref:Kinesin-like protein n=1 Tax=Aphanomyces invadans TaxID=157072 RepID=A0A024U2I1_9STRA|nr:hypothetical protein, variant 1 [Aphanomyces invadans]ETW00117.1 hypothetical protein, variant 1 [Aphanomyces invadans]|eukprot:XP_008871142.1 hypothetical protein, variant 1 [Aphanomyces invadans]
MSGANNASSADLQGVKVYVRVRPMSTAEVEQGCDSAFAAESTSITLGPKTYTFDKVFDATQSQDHVFSNSAAALLDGFFQGYNATVFAYGQTGSGKTYTMGVEHGGVIPHVVDEVFSRSKKLDTDKMTTVVLKMSYLEIFNEEVFDLLAPTASTSLNVRDDIKRGIVVCGLSEHIVSSTEEVNQLLLQGASKRATASTGMNDTSSRSHAICTLSMHQQPAEDSAKFSKFHLVDLAGSERAKRTLATGDRFKEGVHINQALLTLGKVITALSDKKAFVPYRESKLTRLLQDSLGGNSKTVMIACVSPADSNYEETTSTLRYAERTRCIQNKAVINKDPGACEIKYLRQQVELLQLQLLQAKSTLHAPTHDGLSLSLSSSPVSPSSAVELTRMKKEIALLRQAKEQWKSIAQHQHGDERALTQAVEMEMEADGVLNTSADLENMERVIEEKEAMMALLNSVDEHHIGAELEALGKKYEEKIQTLQTPTKKSQLAVVMAAQTEVRRLQRLHQQGQLKISSLQIELTSMKQLKASLQRKLKTEVVNAQKEQRKQSLTIMQLQRKDAKKQVEIQKLSQLHAHQNTLLKRKNDELVKLQSSKRFKPSEPAVLSTDAATQLVDEVLDVEMTIVGAKAAIKVEIEERIEIAKTLRRTPPGPEKQKIDLQLADKNAVIRKLQQKLDLVEKHHRHSGGTASQLCPSSVQSCHKVIQALLTTTVSAKKRCLELADVDKQLAQTEEQLVEQRATADSLAAEVKRLEVELESRPPKKERPKPKVTTDVEEDEMPSESEDDGGEYDDDSDYTEDRNSRGRTSSGRKDKIKVTAATVTPGDAVAVDCCQCNGKCATKACACRARSGRCGDKCTCKPHKCVNRGSIVAGDVDSNSILQELCGPNHELSLRGIASPAPLKTPILSPFGSKRDKENSGVHVLVTPPPPMHHHHRRLTADSPM